MFHHYYAVILSFMFSLSSTEYIMLTFSLHNILEPIKSHNGLKYTIWYAFSASESGLIHLFLFYFEQRAYRKQQMWFFSLNVHWG